MRRLAADEFRETMPTPGGRVPGDQPAPFDFWPYFDAIPAEDFEGHDCSAGLVQSVHRDEDGEWEHVLVCTEDQNTFMVLVLNVARRLVHGHHLLDLNEHYGLRP